MTVPLPVIPRRPLKGSYDYVVVGSGSGGAAVTRRLVDAGAEVLLIEAGPAGIGIDAIDDPTQWVGLIGGTYDWGYAYALGPHIDGRVIAIPRGKVLGGSTAINAMMWYRGHPRDYDAWDESGAKGWRFADVLPYFRHSEDWEDGSNEWRGAGGPLRIRRSPDPHPLSIAMVEGAGSLGMPVIDDPNGADNEGATLSNFNIANGRRWSSAQGYLWPVLDRKNLTILTGSLATGLAFEGNRCIAVRHLHGGAPVETRATKEIILALGALDTPRLLMMSGIGDPAELKRLGIATRLALPGVGQNLQDHPLLQAVNFRSKRPLGSARDNGGGAMLNWKTDPSLPQANVHAFPVHGPNGSPELRARHDLSGDIFSIGTGLMRSASRGYLRLLGSEPGAPMEIQPNFFAEPQDLADLIDAVGFIMELGQTKAYADWFDGFAAPVPPVGRDAMATFVREACSTFFHACGTCKMGEDQNSVVDSRLRVHGAEGLRIADASIIPVIPSCNTHAPTTMIGERAADFVLETA